MTYAHSDAALRFNGRSDRRLAQHQASVSAGIWMARHWLLRSSFTYTVDGTITGSGDPADLGAGFAVSAMATRLWPVEGSPQAYVATTVSLAFAMGGGSWPSNVELHNLSAVDVRVGGILGWTLFEVWTPYAAGRLFGGPVSWQAKRFGDEALTGTSRTHMQLAMGSTVDLPAGLYASLEWAFVGETGVSVEVGKRL